MSRKIYVLVIDDEAAVRETICENLEDVGFEVAEAIDGEHALDVIKNGKLPDIVVTDLIMPKMEGLETIINMRKIHPSIKIIAISGGGQAKAMDFLALAKSLGADATLAKPIDMEELEITLRNLCGK